MNASGRGGRLFSAGPQALLNGRRSRATRDVDDVISLTEELRILVVDDDPGLRLLLRATLAAEEFTVDEARSAEEAVERLQVEWPRLVILDVGLPGASGVSLCRRLKESRAFGWPKVILLTGGDTDAREARDAGADALLHKPFSPVALVGLVDRLLDDGQTRDLGFALEPVDQEQLIAYANDLNQLLQVERRQRRLLQHAYRATVTALTDALEARDPGTGMHAVRVQRYALELTDAVDSSLRADPGLEYGYLLHDIGKIGVPDHILRKPGRLTEHEFALIRRHPVIGTQILRDVALLDGQGVAVVRSHHERWDGTGYPDRLRGRDIPVGARIFAVVDALDAMTSDRPYRRAMSWQTALKEIDAESGRQFDPDIVAAFHRRESRLEHIHADLAPIARAG
jgi:cyclic di-GMP phosphodiesterase